MTAPNMLARAGWTKSTLKPGDERALVLPAPHRHTETLRRLRRGIEVAAHVNQPLVVVFLDPQQDVTVVELYELHRIGIEHGSGHAATGLC